MTKQILAALLMAACSTTNSGGGGGDNPDASTNGGSDDASQPPSDGQPQGARTIYTIVLENHDYAEIVGSSNAPYLNSLIAQGGLATEYYDTIHPSLGNYLHMISGANQYPGIIDLDPTTYPFPVDKQNLGTQMEAAGVPWRSYQESMGTPCKLSGSGKYAPKHDPFLYFKDMQKGANDLCKQRNVDYSQFAADLATNEYRYMWITPNLDDDGHDPQSDPVQGLRTSDMWMSHEVPKILASAGFQNGGVLFITWDEAEGRANDDGDKIPMIVLSPRLKAPGMKVTTHYTHASYLATVEDMLGLQRLDTVKMTPNMMEFLNP